MAQERDKITTPEEWRKQVFEPSARENGQRDTPFRTSFGTDIDPLYAPKDPDDKYLEDVGFPAQFPFTRGIYPTMYRGRLWTQRQYAGFGGAEDTNERYKFLLSQGQTGLSVALDLPTHMGYDADDPIAEAEVGNVGVSISSLRDVEIMFNGISLDEVTVSYTENATGPMLYAMHVAVAKMQGVDLEDIGGTTQNDILKEYIARGTYIFPPKPSMRLITDMIAFCKDNTPKWNPISISGYHMREAGATAAQEVGFTFANAIAYCEAGLEAGLGFDEFAPRLSFFWAIHNNFLEEIAKSRASRRLWARLAKSRFGAKDERSMMLRLHVQTGGATLTRQQVENNIVRAAFQAMAAVLGGTQSMSVSCFDEAHALPTEESQRISLRTQQIIAHETGITDTIDPLAGSYYLERLTDQIEMEAEEYIERIDSMGGAVAAIEQGFQQREIQESAFKHQREVEAGERIIVGVNKFTEGDRPPDVVHRPDPNVGVKQRERLAQLRSSRNEANVRNAKRILEKVASTNENLIPVLMDCFGNDVTLGEVCEILRGVWGEYRAFTVI